MTEALTATTGNTTQPPVYRGDETGPFKELGPDQRQALDLQLADHTRLNEIELHSELRHRFAAGDTTMPAGTLLHGTSYSTEAVASIAAHGVMSGELFGVVEDAETHYCADFFRTEEATTVADYSQKIGEIEPTTGAISTRRMEGNYLPNPKTRDERMGIIVDTNIPEVQPLLEADAYRAGTDELFTGIINHLPIDKNSPKAERVAAILGGVPRGAIAGIVVSPKLAENAEHIAELNSAFEGKVPLINIDGTLLLPEPVAEAVATPTSPVEAPYRSIQFGKVYDELQDGQAVNIAALGNIFVEIDEANLGLERVTLENLQKGWEAQSESFTQGLKERGIEADPFTVFKWYQIQRKAFQTLGEPNLNAGERNRRFIEQSDRVKLSETKGFAMCSEYAILSAYMAQKIGEPAHLIIGAAIPNDQEQWREAHAFVWADGLNAVFDSVQAQSDNEYPALMIPKTPVTFEALEAGLDVEAKRIGTDFTAHYGLAAGGFGVKSAHDVL